MRSLALILLLAAAPALAETRIARQGADEVRVYDSPCMHAETLIRIPQERRGDFRKAQGTFGGQPFFGCWSPNGDSVYVLWEDGDQGIVPLADLKPIVEI